FAARLQARPRPPRGGLDLVLRGIESRSRNGGGPGIRPAKSDLRSERVEEVLRLRRQDVERVGDNELRPLQLRQDPLQRIRQPRSIEVVVGVIAVWGYHTCEGCC